MICRIFQYKSIIL